MQYAPLVLQLACNEALGELEAGGLVIRGPELGMAVKKACSRLFASLIRAALVILPARAASNAARRAIRCPSRVGVSCWKLIASSRHDSKSSKNRPPENLVAPELEGNRSFSNSEAMKSGSNPFLLHVAHILAPTSSPTLHNSLTGGVVGSKLGASRKTHCLANHARTPSPWLKLEIPSYSVTATDRSAHYLVTGLTQ